MSPFLYSNIASHYSFCKVVWALFAIIREFFPLLTDAELSYPGELDRTYYKLTGYNDEKVYLIH